MSDEITLASAAMTYIKAGWPVFPLQPGTKIPFKGSHGFEDASLDPQVVERWWTSNPIANIGTPTGVKVDSLDVDNRRSGDGFDNLERCVRAGLVRGAIARMRTRNAGEQWLYPAANPPQSCTSIKGEFIDIKAAGGYIVLPPSVVPADDGIDGPGRYSWLEFDTSTEGAPLDAEAIKNFLKPPRTPNTTNKTAFVGSGSITGLVNKVASEVEGNRNNALWWAAKKAIAEGLDVEELRSAALEIGLTPAEVDATIKSAQRWAT